MKSLILILLLLYFADSKAESRDLNIYGSLFSSYGLVEIDLEYEILNTSLLGISTSTFLKAGTSMFGIQGLSVQHSSPIIGFIQYFGNKEGADIGISYFKHNKTGTDNNRNVSTIFNENENIIRFEGGYRNYFDDNAIFRFTVVSFFEMEKLKKNENLDLKFLISFSVGYSF